MKTHYEILGLLPGAEDVVVKAAYKALAQKFHPDKNEANRAQCHDIMAKLNAAYDVLRDADKRKRYDQSLTPQAQKTHKPSSDAKPRPEQARRPEPEPAQARNKEHRHLVNELLRNTIDEISAIKLYEQAFRCRVRINDGWVNTYTVVKSSGPAGPMDRVNFTQLKSQLLEHFHQSGT